MKARLKRILQYWHYGALLAVGISLAACAIPNAPDSTVAATEGKLYVADEVIALMPSGTIAAPLRNGAAAAGFELQENVALEAFGLQMLRFSFPEPYDGKAAIAVLEAVDPSVTAGVNHAYRLAASSTIRDFAYADELMGWPTGGCRLLGAIGMLDTGIDSAIRDRMGDAIQTASFVRGEAVSTAHGTAVASVLLDERRTIGARVYSAIVVDQSSDGQALAAVDSLITGLNWLAAEGVRVVNISLAGPYNKLLDRALNASLASGIIVIAAAGNDGENAPAPYPAAFDGVIGVTAIDANRKVYRKANRGSHIDVAAPGVDIAVASGSQVRFVSGTSIATPFVTLRIATDPALYGQSASDVRASLMETTIDLGPRGFDPTFGAGLLRATKACQP